MPITVVKSLEEMADLVPRFLGINTGGGAFGLAGDLGVGKTTFVRMVVENLAHLNGAKVPRVTSPSYVLHQLYEIGSATVDHFDLYRLETVSEEGLLELGYFEAQKRAEAGGWLFIEWPTRLPKQHQPKQTIEFSFTGDSRSIHWD